MNDEIIIIMSSDHRHEDSMQQVTEDNPVMEIDPPVKNFFQFSMILDDIGNAFLKTILACTIVVSMGIMCKRKQFLCMLSKLPSYNHHDHQNHNNTSQQQQQQQQQQQEVGEGQQQLPWKLNYWNISVMDDHQIIIPYLPKILLETLVKTHHQTSNNWGVINLWFQGLFQQQILVITNYEIAKQFLHVASFKVIKDNICDMDNSSNCYCQNDMNSDSTSHTTMSTTTREHLQYQQRLVPLTTTLYETSCLKWLSMPHPLQSTTSTTKSSTPINELEYFYKQISNLLYDVLFPIWDTQVKSQTMDIMDWMFRLSSDTMAVTTIGQTMGGLNFNKNYTKYTEISKEKTQHDLFEWYQQCIKITHKRCQRGLSASILFYWKEQHQYKKNMNLIQTKVMQVIQNQMDIHGAIKNNPNFDWVSKSITSTNAQTLFQSIQSKWFTSGQTETLTNLLSFGLWELGSNPNIQFKLQQELDVFFESTPQSYQLLSELSYLEFITLEIIRLYTPITMIQSTNQDLNVFVSKARRNKRREFHIPKHTKIWIVPCLLQRRRRNFMQMNNHNGSSFFIPSNALFSLTPIEMVQFKTILAHILRRYTIRINNDDNDMKSRPTIFESNPKILLNLELRAAIYL